MFCSLHTSIRTPRAKGGTHRIERVCSRQNSVTNSPEATDISLQVPGRTINQQTGWQPKVTLRGQHPLKSCWGSTHTHMLGAARSSEFKQKKRGGGRTQKNKVDLREKFPF